MCLRPVFSASFGRCFRDVSVIRVPLSWGVQMLFKAKYFDRFKSGTVSTLDTFSQNSALSILAIRDCVRSHFYDIDLGELVELLRRGLPSEELLRVIPFDISREMLPSHDDKRFRLLCAHFYRYFFERLPVLFRWNRLIHRGRKRRLGREEVDAIVRSCVTRYVERYGDVGVSLLPDEYRRFAGFARWCVRRKVQSDQVYAIEWLWDALSAVYPDIMIPTNTGSITGHVIESCFPMFWDSLQERHRDTMICFANLGWFIGDADIDEIEAAFKLSDEKSPRK